MEGVESVHDDDPAVLGVAADDLVESTNFLRMQGLDRSVGRSAGRSDNCYPRLRIVLFRVG